MSTTWCCSCGENGTAEGGIRAASKALTEHMTASGHSKGEYSYGTERRTTVEVVLDEGTPVQRIIGQ